MSSNNGVEQARRIQREARARYGSALMSVDGVIVAALSEPVCLCSSGCSHKTCAHKEDREESAFWDKALVGAIRAMNGLDPLESFT